MNNIFYSYLIKLSDHRKSPDIIMWLMEFLLYPFFIVIDFSFFSIRNKFNIRKTIVNSNILRIIKYRFNIKSTDIDFFQNSFVFIICTILLIIYFVLIKGITSHQFNSLSEFIHYLNLHIVWSFKSNLCILFFFYIFAFPARTASIDLEYKLSDNLLGDKLWAKKRIHSLLNKFRIDQGGRRAKWFIVNFLSEIADERIENIFDDSGFYTISTGHNTWPILKYSSFLSKNMEHAEDKMLWLVDPNDFFGVLLPEFIKYFFASCAIAAYEKRPNISFEDTHRPSIENIFSIYKDPPPRLNIS